MTDEVLGNEVVSSQCFSGPEKQERFDILLTEQNFSSGAELCSLLVLGEPASIASQNEYNIILNLLITQQGKHDVGSFRHLYEFWTAPSLVVDVDHIQ